MSPGADAMLLSQINVVEVLSDSMYSDSHQVIDALAELIEATVQISDDKVISPGRMSQVRHIIQVDEISFQAQFTPQQLKTIESHEMATIVEDLISAIGLQRFRFTERQENGTSFAGLHRPQLFEPRLTHTLPVVNSGDYDLCRNLARIAASVCDTWVDIVAQEQPVELPETGVIHLLMKAAGHPSVNLCAICLQVLTRVMPIIPSLAQELLPTLQRRAITPHHLNDGFIGLDASDLCGVTFHEFQNFRSTVLSEALIVCWRGYGDHFMDSCTSAVEEFCSSSSSVNVSLPLEAALFCIEQVAAEALNSHRPFAHTEQMRRLLAALPAKPPSLLSNPLTRERMCRFLRKVRSFWSICVLLGTLIAFAPLIFFVKYSQWCTTNGRLEAAADLVMSSFRIAISSDPNVGMLSNSVREFSLSSIHEASLALKVIICSAPRNFTNDSSIASLSGKLL